METVKIIKKEHAVSRSTTGTPGIYVLIDPTDGCPRYVGSTRNAEHRLFAHVASCGRCRTAKDRWLFGLKTRGVWPEMWVLEVGDFGNPQSQERHAAEAKWIEVCQELFDGADVNTALTPVGHVNSKDSSGKKLNAEVRALRKRIAYLENELAVLRGLEMQRAT